MFTEEDGNSIKNQHRRALNKKKYAKIDLIFKVGLSPSKKFAFFA